MTLKAGKSASVEKVECMLREASEVEGRRAKVRGKSSRKD